MLKETPWGDIDEAPKKRDTRRMKGEEEWGQVLNPKLLQSQHTGKAMPTQLETSCRTIPLHLANTETRSFASNFDGLAFHRGFTLFSPKSWVIWGKQIFLFGFGFLTNSIRILKINKLVSYITACASHWTPSCLPRQAIWQLRDLARLSLSAETTPSPGCFFSAGSPFRSLLRCHLLEIFPDLKLTSRALSPSFPIISSVGLLEVKIIVITYLCSPASATRT